MNGGRTCPLNKPYQTGNFRRLGPSATSGWSGCWSKSLPYQPLEDRAALARAFQCLPRRLRTKALRRLCGWEGARAVPSEATSLTFAESEAPARRCWTELAGHVEGQLGRESAQARPG